MLAGETSRTRSPGLSFGATMTCIGQWCQVFPLHRLQREATRPDVSSVGSSVGMDHGSAVSDRCSAPFEFTGAFHDVVIELPTRRSKSQDAATAASEMARQ